MNAGPFLNQSKLHMPFKLTSKLLFGAYVSTFIIILSWGFIIYSACSEKYQDPCECNQIMSNKSHLDMQGGALSDVTDKGLLLYGGSYTAIISTNNTCEITSIQIENS